MPFQSFFQSPYRYLVIFAGGAFFLALSNLSGLGFTFDSFDYFNAGTHLNDFLLKSPIEGKIIARPPFFPFLIAVFWWGLPIMSLLLFAISSLLFLRILDQSNLTEESRIIIFFIFIFSIPLHLSHSFLWTEMVVIPILLAHVYYVFRPYSSINSFILVILGILLVLTKNGGMLWLPGFVLVYLFIHRGRAIIPAGIYGFAVAMTYAIWSRYIARPTIAETVIQKTYISLEPFNVISGWFFPLAIRSEIRLAILLLLIVGMGLYWFRISPSLNRRSVSFVFLFCAYLLLRGYYSHVDYHETERYMAIVFPVFLLSIATSINELQKSKLGSLLIFYWIVYSVIRVVKNDIIWFIERNL